MADKVMSVYNIHCILILISPHPPPYSILILPLLHHHPPPYPILILPLLHPHPYLPVSSVPTAAIVTTAARQ